MIGLGGRWLTVEISGTPVVLAGNERPWLAATADLRDCPPPAPAGPLRIALAHSPDRFASAQAQECDLLLAGHTHGGQICLPPLGAILSPSINGVKYVSGVYYAPPTILHVTRGVSGDFPVRWNCCPEIAHSIFVPKTECYGSSAVSDPPARRNAPAMAMAGRSM